MTSTPDTMQSTGEEPGPSFADLPADFVSLLYEALPLKAFVSASCTCQHWSRCADRVWEGKCRARWQYWNNTPPASSSNSSSDDPTGYWRDAYRQRHQLDKEVFAALQSAAWPDEQCAAYSSIMQMGDDALDALAAAAHSSSSGNGLTVGLVHHATVALHFVRGAACAQRLQQLLDGQQQQQHQGQDGSSITAAAAPAGAASSSDASDAGVVLEGALLLAQALHPLSDVAAVRGLVSGMAQELQRRMQQAQATPGSKQSIQLLNQLMFGQPPAAAAAGSAAPDAANSTTEHPDYSSSTAGASSGRDCSSGGLRCSWWHRNVDLGGPELSAVEVPRDGCSGMGFKGNSDDYYSPLNSCLDSVIASRRGLPITLAVLYAAVAAAAGLTVQLVNMPGHIIVRARLQQATKAMRDTAAATAAAAGHAEEAVSGSGIDTSSSSSSGNNSDGGGCSWMYVDVFDGGRELDVEGVRSILLRYSSGPLATTLDAALQPLSPTNTIKRMLANLVHTFKQAHASRTLTAQLQDLQPDPPRLQLQLQSISVVLLACGIIPLVYTAQHEFDLFVQLAHLVGMGPLVHGPPGAVLLMRKLAASLPPALKLWQLKMEAGANEMARRQQLQPSQVLHRSEHPGVQYSIGDCVCYQQGRLTVPRPPVTGVIVGWHVARGSGGALGPALAAADGDMDTSSRVFYQLVVDGRILCSCHQQDISSLPGSSSGPIDAEARAAWAASYAQQQQWHQQQSRDSWFEQEELAGMKLGEQQQSQPFSLSGWPDRHLQLGQFFDAAWDVVGAGGMGMGVFALNPYYRSKYPEG